MLRDTAGQWRVALAMAAAGAAMGLYYDLLRAARRRLEAGVWLSLAADLVFGAGAAGIFIAASLRACWGQVRLYELAAAGIGFALYRGGPGPLLRGAAERIQKTAGRLAGWKAVKNIFR